MPNRGDLARIKTECDWLYGTSLRRETGADVADFDPLTPFLHLRDELEKTAQELGLSITPGGFAILPADQTDGTHFAHVLFRIDNDALLAPETKATKDEFDRMMMMERQSEHEQRKQQAREDLLEALKKDDGILDDTEE